MHDLIESYMAAAVGLEPTNEGVKKVSSLRKLCQLGHLSNETQHDSSYTKYHIFAVLLLQILYYAFSIQR